MSVVWVGVGCSGGCSVSWGGCGGIRCSVG